MAIRYNDLKKPSRDGGNFVTRKYNPSLYKIIGILLLTVALSIAVMVMLLPKVTTIILLTIINGGVGAYVIAKVQAARDMILTTEYQNALFASGLSHGFRFCCIVRREGSISYMDQGTQRMFSDLMKERQLTLNNLLMVGRASKEVQEKVLDIVARGVDGKLICELRGQDNRLHQVLLTVTALKRPAGYLLVRARDYSEAQATTAAKAPSGVNPLLSKSTIGMFAHIMDRMHMGMYMIDMQGNLLYANPQLEEWLNFKKGEIVASTYSMRDIVHGISAVDAINPGDFEGEHALLNKEGGLIKAYINQKIVYGDAEKPLGCVALITNIIDSDTDSKKTLW